VITFLEKKVIIVVPVGFTTTESIPAFQIDQIDLSIELQGIAEDPNN